MLFRILVKDCKECIFKIKQGNQALKVACLEPHLGKACGLKVCAVVLLCAAFPVPFVKSGQTILSYHSEIPP